MNTRSQKALVWMLLATFCGCSSSTSIDQEGEIAESDETFVLGDLLTPFDPPSLEQLEQTVAAGGGWVERPVLDSLELLRARQAQEPVLATVDEAIALRNNSKEENTKILSALGRLPKNDNDVDYAAQITRATPQALNNQNPLLASTMTEFEVSSLTGFGLFGFDWNFTPYASPDSVVSWETSKDGLYDKVVMRNDLLWSDGTPITAHDIEFSFKVIMSSQVPIRAQRTGTEAIKYVKAYDDQTLVYFHNRALQTNVWNINFSIIPKHVYEKSIAEDPTLVDSDYHVRLEEKPVTGGGYEVIKRDQVEVILKRRKSAYMFAGKQVRDKPFFEIVRLRIIPEASVRLLSLEAGDIDEMNLEPQQWSDQTNNEDFYRRCTKARGLEWTSFSFQWNENTPFFADSKVRQAMTWAFDHQEMLHVHRKGLDQPCTGTYHPTSRWYPGSGNAVGVKIEPVQQDFEKAKRLLDEAGWVDTDGDGYRDKEIDGRNRKFEFTIIVRNAKERIDLCELLAQNLRLVGVACNVKPLESATLQDKLFNKQFAAAFGGWGTGADPDTSENIWGSDQQRNFVDYKNPLIDELFEEGRKMSNDRKRWKDLSIWKDPEVFAYLQVDPSLADERPSREDCYAAIHAILWRDQPYTWLFYRNACHGFNKRLRGYNFSPRGIFGYGPGFSSLWMPREN